MRTPLFLVVLTFALACAVSPVRAEETAENCVLDFKELLQWRIKTLLIGQDAKYKSDCIIEIKRKELTRPGLSPKCQRVLFGGSSVDDDANLKEALDSRKIFFKKADKERLTDLHYRIVDATLSEARMKCSDKPMTPSEN